MTMRWQWQRGTRDVRGSQAADSRGGHRRSADERGRTAAGSPSVEHDWRLPPMPLVVELLEVRPRVTIRDRISVRPSAFDRLSGPGAPTTNISNPQADGDSGLIEASRGVHPMIGADGLERRQMMRWPLRGRQLVCSWWGQTRFLRRRQRRVWGHKGNWRTRGPHRMRTGSSWDRLSLRGPRHFPCWRRSLRCQLGKRGSR